ncbi:hypothetical protein [Chenggangzhangella methanolivorans]|uniref:Uncharacterized protein n=1 Tax=Chenggangzhangella methanolivorans TaxID=1437009 RepID=A0A9E6RAC6_9HYPH|nr:hypothetical protein [Chenggangzhangella methanolivorans]QZO01094.1 hypothetical protein K6K41_05830 [Chenggangzhangella methanolivorans]
MEFREKLKEDLAIFRQRLIWLEDGTMRSYEYSRGHRMDRVPDAIDYTKRIIAEIEKCLAEHSERGG